MSAINNSCKSLSELVWGRPDTFPYESLYHASIKGDLEAVRTWLKGGADVNQAMPDGTTPLFIAALIGHWEVVEFLAKNGALVGQARNDGKKPLFVAVETGHSRV